MTIMRNRVYLLAGSAVLTLACGSSTGPNAVASRFFDAQLHGRFDEAYSYVVTSDRLAKSLEAYKDDLALGVLFAGKTSFSVKGAQINSDSATVTMAVTAPDYSDAMEGMFGAALAGAFGGQSSADTQKAIASKLASSPAPMKTHDVPLSLRQENGSWKVVTGWAGAAKMVEAKALEDKKELQAARVKYQEAVEAGAEQTDMKAKLEALDVQIELQKEQTAYFDHVTVQGVYSHLATDRPFDESAVFGEIRNEGDRILSTVQITIYCLDGSGKPLFEKTYSPVRVSEFSFSPDTNQPLKPNYSRKFGVRMQDAPKGWHGEVQVKVTNVEFSS